MAWEAQEETGLIQKYPQIVSEAIYEISQKAKLKNCCNEEILQEKKKNLSQKGPRANEQFNMRVTELWFGFPELSYKI